MSAPTNPKSTAAQLAAAQRFKAADQPAARRLIMSLYGDEKTGKTNFALTSPGPVGVINIDIGLDGVIQKFQADKQIHVSKYRLRVPPKGSSMEQVAAAAVQVWDDIMEDYHYALSNFRTCIIDTADEAWSFLRLARFGKLDQVKPHHYGPVNAEFRDLYREAYDTDCNLIMTHKSKAQYVNESRTGQRERAGFSDTGFLVQVELECLRLPLRDREGGQDPGFRARVVSCRQNPTITDQLLAEPFLNFQALACMVFPDSDPDEWV